MESSIIIDIYEGKNSRGENVTKVSQLTKAELRDIFKVGQLPTLEDIQKVGKAEMKKRGAHLTAISEINECDLGKYFISRTDTGNHIILEARITDMIGAFNVTGTINDTRKKVNKSLRNLRDE